MKKIMLLDTWNVEKLESWFSYMAEQGWHLTEIKRGQACFEKGDAKKVEYRIDTFQINELKGQNKIAENEKLGWQYIDSIGYIHIFREKAFAEATEFYTNSMKHAESLLILRRSHLMKTIFAALFVALFYWLFFAMTDFVHVYLENHLLLQLFFLVLFSYIVLKMFTGVIYLSNLIRKLKNGDQFHRMKMTKMKFKLIKLQSRLLITLAVFVTVAGFVEIFSSSYKPIPDEELPIVKLSEILESQKYENIQYDDDFSQYYREEASFFVPRQYELRQSATIAMEPPYEPVIWTKRYEARFESIAKQLVPSLVEESLIHGTYERKPHSSMDELWVIEEEEFTSFIARVGKDVYVVNYWGVEPIETLIQYSINFNREVKFG